MVLELPCTRIVQIIMILLNKATRGWVYMDEFIFKNLLVKKQPTELEIKLAQKG